MKIKYHKKFEKSYRKKTSKIRIAFQEKLRIFMKNPFSITLNNHTLKGEYLGYNSINISGDYRAIFRELSGGKYEFVEFIKIGTHSELYK